MSVDKEQQRVMRRSQGIVEYLEEGSNEIAERTNWLLWGISS